MVNASFLQIKLCGTATLQPHEPKELSFENSNFKLFLHGSLLEHSIALSFRVCQAALSEKILLTTNSSFNTSFAALFKDSFYCLSKFFAVAYFKDLGVLAYLHLHCKHL